MIISTIIFYQCDSEGVNDWKGLTWRVVGRYVLSIHTAALNTTRAYYCAVQLAKYYRAI